MVFGSQFKLWQLWFYQWKKKHGFISGSNQFLASPSWTATENSLQIIYPSNIFQHLPTSSNIFQHLPTSSNIFQHLPTLDRSFMDHQSFWVNSGLGRDELDPDRATEAVKSINRWSCSTGKRAKKPMEASKMMDHWMNLMRSNHSC